MPDIELDKPTTRVRRVRTPLSENVDDEVTSGAGLGDLDAAMDEIAGEEDTDEPDNLLETLRRQSAEEEGEEILPLVDRSLDPEVQPETEQELLDKPSVTLAQANRASRETKASPGRSAVSERVSDDFADILENLDFGVDAHQIYIERLEPQVDPHNPHRRIRGHCGKYSRMIDIDEIRTEHGGGRYAITVRGPKESTGRGSQIKARRVIEIAGAPIPMPDPRAEAEIRKKEEQKQSDLVDKMLSREDDRTRRQEEKADNLEVKLQEQQMNMLEMVAKMGEQKTDPAVAMSAALNPVLEAMREDGRRRDDEQRAERERDEVRRTEARERDEVRRREDKEREEVRRREEREDRERENKRLEQQFQLQLKQIEAQAVTAKESAKSDATMQQSYMSMMMQFMTKTGSDKDERAQASTTMQMEMMKQMGDERRLSMESQMKLIMDQANNKDDFFDNIEKFQTFQNIVNPQETDDRSGVERAIDKIGEIAPGIVAGLGTLQQQRPQMNPGQPGQPALPAPGTVAVVEDIDAAVPRESSPLDQDPWLTPEQMSGDAPPAGSEPAQEQVQVTVEPELVEQQQPAQRAAPRETEAVMVNPLQDFPAAYTGTTNEEVLTELVHRLDLAVRNDLDHDEMYSRCLEPLPVAQKVFVQALPDEVLIEYIENNVPADWPLRSLAGEEAVRECHTRLKEGA